MTNKESSGITRRQVLKAGLGGAASIFITSCGGEPIKRIVKGIRESAKEGPTVANTPKATKELVETNTPAEKAPTEVPTPENTPTSVPTQEISPTPDLEATRQVQAKLWEERTFALGEGLKTGGGLEINSEVLARQETFKTNVYEKLAEMNILAKDSWLLFGTHSPWLEQGLHPAQMDDSRFVALLGTKAGGQTQIFCFSENLEEGEEGITVEESCGGVGADEQIWGKDFETVVSAGKPEERQAILVGPEDNYFSFSVGALGTTDILTPVIQNKEGNWIVDKKKFEEEGEKKGFLVTAGQDGKIASFMLNYDNVPSVPEGKTPEEELKLKDSIDAHFDIISGMIYVWNLEETESESEKGFHYCGYYCLETGEWKGEKEWEEYSSLFEAKAKPQPEKPAWLPEVSNTEIKYNQEDERWEYYTNGYPITVSYYNKQEKKMESNIVNGSQYLVSVRHAEKGNFELFNFADIVYPRKHPELFARSTWQQIEKRMSESGAVKVLPCGMENVESLSVQRFPEFRNIPGSLEICFQDYPNVIYYPYDKGSQACPSINPRNCILFPDINEVDSVSVSPSPKVYAFNSRGKIRKISDEENLAGNGIFANLGTKLINLQNGSVELLGRQEEEFNNSYNRMTLDSFVRDSHGRLMHPGE